MSDSTGDQGADPFGAPPTGRADHPDPSRPQSSFPHPPPQQAQPPGPESFPPPAPGSFPPPAGQPQSHGSPFEPPNAPFSQPGYGAPAGAQMPPVQQKKRRIWPWLLFGIPLLFALLIGGCSLLLFGAVRGPVDATNAYIANLDNGDYGAAYDSLCASSRSSIDREEWITGVGFDIGGEITGYNFSQVEIVGGTATVTGTLEVDGATRSRIFDLVDEGGDWRVCFN